MAPAHDTGHVIPNIMCGGNKAHKKKMAPLWRDDNFCFVVTRVWPLTDWASLTRGSAGRDGWSAEKAVKHKTSRNQSGEKLPCS